MSYEKLLYAWFTSNKNLALLDHSIFSGGNVYNFFSLTAEYQELALEEDECVFESIVGRL